MTQNLVYIANGGNGPHGITVAELDYANDTLNIVQQVSEISECHYLNPHPNGRILVAGTMDEGVQVVSFAIDPADGHLRLLSRQPAGGDSPAYVCVDASGKNLLMVNYRTAGGGRGNIRVYPIDGDGIIRAHSDMIEHDGHSVNPDRQETSHPHMIVTTPDNRLPSCRIWARTRSIFTRSMPTVANSTCHRHSICPPAPDRATSPFIPSCG